MIHFFCIFHSASFPIVSVHAPTGCTLDVAIAVDMSGSVGDDEGTLKTFLKDLSSQMEAMDPRIHTALIRFANK